MTSQRAISANEHEVTELSPVTESITDKAEYKDLIVLNTGNSVTGYLLRSLIEYVDKLGEHVDSCRKELKELADRIPQLTSAECDKKVKETAEKFFEKFKSTQDSKLGALQQEMGTEMEAMKSTNTAQLEAINSQLADLSKENENLKDQLTSQEKKLADQQTSIDALSKKLSEKTNQATAETPANQKRDFSELTFELTSKLNDLVDHLIPKEVTEQRRSMIQTHADDTRSNYGKGRPKSFAPSDSTDSIDSPVLIPRSHSASSTTSSGYRSLLRKDSELASIDEGDGLSLSLKDNESSLNFSPGPDESLDTSPVVLRPHSTPIKCRGEAGAPDKHTVLGVVWAMSDLFESLKRLTDTTQSFDNQ